MKRNLIYYICPFKSNHEWILNVNELNKYINIFNNKIFVVIATGNKLVNPEKVKKQFNRNDIEFILMPNDKKTGELMPFKRMLQEVYSLNFDEITFYAHAKGVSPKWQNRTNKKYLPKVKVWRNFMYYYCLKDPYEIENILNDFACCGCFHLDENIGDTGCKWLYEGTFFWFNNGRLFRLKDWDSIKKDRYAVEGYLGCKFPRSLSYPLNVNRSSKNLKTLLEITHEEWDNLLPLNLKFSDFEFGFSENKIWKR